MLNFEELYHYLYSIFINLLQKPRGKTTIKSRYINSKEPGMWLSTEQYQQIMLHYRDQYHYFYQFIKENPVEVLQENQD